MKKVISQIKIKVHKIWLNIKRKKRRGKRNFIWVVGELQKD